MFTIYVLLSQFAAWLTVLSCPRDAPATFSGYTLGTNYSNRDSPCKFKGDGKPLEVELRIRIMDILKINEIDTEMTMDLLINRIWLEPRLRFTQAVVKGRQYPVDPQEQSRFWKPDIYVMGMREFRTRQGMMELDNLILYEDKKVNHLLRATLVLKCKFDFQLYPLDSQECKLDFMSPLQPMEDQELLWWRMASPVEFYKRKNNMVLKLTEWSVKLVRCPTSFATLHVAGNVSSLRVWVVLHRIIKNHLLEVYVPTGMFVVVSWGSFLVKPDVVPGRMVLLVTNLLSLITLFEACRVSAPPANMIKCLDVWLLMCIMFVFMALLEYAAILFKTRGTFFKKNIKNIQLFSAVKPKTPMSSVRGRKRVVAQKIRLMLRRLPWNFMASILRFSSPQDSSWCRLDQLSVIIFPLAFLTFNIVYWVTYLDASVKRLTSTVCET